MLFNRWQNIQQQEVAMDRLDYGCALDEVVERPDRSRGSNKSVNGVRSKRWKDKHRLIKELQEIDNNFNYDIDAIQL